MGRPSLSTTLPMRRPPTTAPSRAPVRSLPLSIGLSQKYLAKPKFPEATEDHFLHPNHEKLVDEFLGLQSLSYDVRTIPLPWFPKPTMFSLRSEAATLKLTCSTHLEGKCSGRTVSLGIPRC